MTPLNDAHRHPSRRALASDLSSHDPIMLRVGWEVAAAYPSSSVGVDASSIELTMQRDPAETWDEKIGSR